MQYGNRRGMHMTGWKFGVFKSYYVVWKPKASVGAVPTQVGLNRTMQYGNNDKDSSDVVVLGGLNRTMQYGN